ncbi:MAG: 2-oxo acid dehydrogenase subunit E2, partial [Vicingaceae bacterium]
MSLEMKVPSPGESITEVEIAQWLVEDGDYVEKDQAIAEVDSDKATLELPAEESGVITLKAEEGDLVQVGAVICLIDTSAEKPAGFESTEEVVEEIVAAPKTEAAPNPNPAPTAKIDVKATPVAKEMISANGINASKVAASGSNGKITKGDIEAYLTSGVDASSSAGWGGTRDEERKKMSMMRRNIAKRLVAVKNETAMLTTFNELDMKPVMDLRKKYKERFKKSHGVNLGFMSFFTKAVTEALKLYPSVNGMIDG